MKRILIIQQKKIGDVLTTSILFEHLHAAFPDAILDYLINSDTLAVVENNPNINSFILFSKETAQSKRKLLKLALDIRNSHYDIIIDVYSKLSSNLITLLSAAKTKISYYKFYSAFVYDHNVKRKRKTDKYSGLAIVNRLQLLEPLGIKATELRPKIYLTQKEISDGKKLLKAHGINFEKPLIMISVLGSRMDKSYPLSFMAQVIDMIVDQTQGQILFNYIPKQQQQSKTIMNLCKPATQQHIFFNILGKSLREFLIITKHCNALIGNEGGAINMAKALDIKTFSIFSPWINKATWALFEDDNTHVSVHLSDFRPDLYQTKAPKEIKKDAISIYQLFSPTLFRRELTEFLKTIS